MLVLMELEGEWEWFGFLYEMYSASGLEADHSDECTSPLCINPDHLQWLTRPENLAKRYRDWR